MSSGYQNETTRQQRRRIERDAEKCRKRYGKSEKWKAAIIEAKIQAENNPDVTVLFDLDME